MKQRSIGSIAILVFLVLALTIGTGQSSAQQPTPTLATPSPVHTPASDFEGRLSKLEAAQTQTIRSLELINENNRAIILGIGGLIAVLVAIQGLATGVQLRREGRRESRQARREAERDKAEHAGIKQVSDVLDVVQRTLESRLGAEEQAREEARRAQSQLQQVLDRFTSLERFYRNFQKTIEKARQDIEETASRLVQVSRHDFKKETNKLNGFAKQFDAFRAEFEALEEEPRPAFSARVPYIRGIAAHYANQPGITKQYLEEVISFENSEPDETPIAHNRRVANAYYYLGLTESNFGNQQDAIDLFEKANQLDLQERDFLTRVVTAEAYVMIDNFDEAEKYITEIEAKLRDIERNDGFLRDFHQRLRSRAILVMANMAILKRGDNWHQEVQELLGPVHEEDPQYYYAIATLAQAHHELAEYDTAQKLFNKAYMDIESLGHMITVTEARSKILLLMIGGLCCRQGLMDERRARTHLDSADDLRNSLPRIGSQVCTVFSPLSKRNEDSGTIRHHIELIREGRVLFL